MQEIPLPNCFHGYKQSSHFAQEVMEDFLHGNENNDTYFGDIRCFDNSLHSHFCTLEAILTHLKDKDSQSIDSNVNGLYKKHAS